MDNTLILALITLLGTFIGSGAVTALVNHILSKKGKIATKLEDIDSRITEIDTHVKAIDNKVDKNEAQRARTQILRFADEIYNRQKHTKEHFDDTLFACSAYNKYCDTHPEFENMRTISAQKLITEIYYKCLAEHSFLDSSKGEE